MHLCMCGVLRSCTWYTLHKTIFCTKDVRSWVTYDVTMVADSAVEDEPSTCDHAECVVVHSTNVDERGSGSVGGSGCGS